MLLKNEDHILPLKQQTVAVIGDFAKSPRYQGAGSSKINPTMLDSGLDALKAAGVHVIGYEPGFRRGGKASTSLLKKACRLAKEAEVVLLWLGLDEGGEAEGVDRSTMTLPQNQLALLDAVSRVNPNIVVILSCGCIVEMDWDSKVKALLHGYLGGQAGATAQAALLTGAANPSGKLSETIPLRYEDVPSAGYYPGQEATSEYREGIYVGYRYYDTAKIAVKYPFGFGLSYTKFDYSHLQIAEDQVRFRIRNTGSCFGEEIAQLYIRSKTRGTFRPEQELKGFVKVSLAPGEEQEVTIPLSTRSFALWSIVEKDWVVEPGVYELRIGASSRDIRLTGTLEKGGAPAANPYPDAAFAPYYTADVTNVPDESFQALLGHPIPRASWNRTAPIGFNDTLSQGEYLPGGFGKFIFRLILAVRSVLMAFGKKELANNVMFAMNLPWRGVARMSGVLQDAQVFAILDMVNRRKGGMRRLIGSMGKQKTDMGGD